MQDGGKFYVHPRPNPYNNLEEIIRVCRTKCSTLFFVYLMWNVATYLCLPAPRPPFSPLFPLSLFFVCSLLTQQPISASLPPFFPSLISCVTPSLYVQWNLMTYICLPPFLSLPSFPVCRSAAFQRSSGSRNRTSNDSTRSGLV